MNILIDTKFGKMLVNDNDTGGGANLIAYGEIAGLELEFLKQFCLPGNIVFDCGANIGNHSLAFAKFVGEEGSVFSFEPQEHCFQLLCSNMALNNIFNVQVFKCALGDNNSNIVFPYVNPTKKFNFGGVSLKETECYTSFVRVEQKRLNEFVHIQKCDLIKIDAEGYESTILRGGSEFVRKFRPVIYCENNRPEQFSDMMSFFQRNNYIALNHFPPSFNENNFKGDKNNYFHGSYKEPNLIALPVEKQHLMKDAKYVE